MIIIAKGGNLPRANGGTIQDTFSQAAKMLKERAVIVRAASPLYRSPAWPPSDQPDYVNGVWLAETALSAPALLHTLHEVERALGRERSLGVANAARTLDLDLVDYRGAVSGGRPVLPHPRMQDRAFVLLPLADVAPDWRHPVSRRTVGELIERLPNDHACLLIEASGIPQVER